ncbi:hypothetical protein BBD42_04965 [Paenibacillus sp. BIHB 4019]|uniref:Uncharacterized protein n=1 Tax=Paenibacillus sp. BIHB 4019 TaxID=1870819 RepID=A0A1B2DDW4_9BACL|nr:hypothetical protein BBD42_04965 [Paenibacillus sp. BIHB 4019]
MMFWAFTACDRASFAGKENTGDGSASLYRFVLGMKEGVEQIVSVYVRDPDRNLIELSQYLVRFYEKLKS